MRRSLWRGLLVACACAALTGSPARSAPAAQPACSAESFEGSGFTVCAFDADIEDLRLDLAAANGVPLRSFGALAGKLGARAARVRFAMNVGMYEPSGRPVGLYIEGGRTLRPLNTRWGLGNFYMTPNGVFSVDADSRVHVETTDQYRRRAPAPMWATQSGPMLLINGALNPNFEPDGRSRLIRDGVGVKDSHTAFFVISDTPVSFGRLARFFRDRQRCRDALFLDGTISSLWAPALKRRDHAYPMGPMVTVLEGRP